MEDHIMLKANSRNEQSLGAPEKDRLTQERQSPNLCDKYNPENSNLSHAYFLHDITKNFKETSPSHVVNHQKQQWKPVVEEEVVKYMSKLPKYLERGESRHEKVLNVGVLDWSQLEKWQGSHKQMQQRSSRPSLSSDNSPSIFTMEGSSLHSSRSTSCSPVCQRTARHSLQFHLMSMSVEGNSQLGQSFEANFAKLQGDWTNTVTERVTVNKTDQTAYKNQQETKLDQPTRKGSDAKTNLQSRFMADGIDYAAMKNMRLKQKNQDDNFTRSQEKLPEQNFCFPDQNALGNKREVQVVPNDLPKSNYRRPQLSMGTAMVKQNLKELSAKSLLEKPATFSSSMVSSDVPLSCLQPSEMVRCSETMRSSLDEESIGIWPEPSQCVPHLDNLGFSPPHGRISGSKKVNSTTTWSVCKEPSMGSQVTTEKGRSTSPFRRLSIGMSKISKNFGSKEGSSMPLSNAAHASGRSDIENAMASFSQDKSTSDVQNAKSRAKSSPLRRLLDPLLKSKPPSCHHSGKASQRDSVTLENPCKSFNRQSNLGTAQPRIGKSAFQALLQVAVKNGQPFFKLAVDNEPNILAATMKKLTTSSEDDYSCIYKFFSFQEVRKRNGRWINQGNKGKGHDCIPNVVAQLKVSGSQFTQKSYMERSFAREFVLLGVDLQQSDQQTLDFQPNNELTAIVVKIPKVINRSKVKDEHQADKCGDVPDLMSDSSRESPPCQLSVNNQGLICTTVILPSGIHSLPNKGGPSSLLQRWRTGGSCDCGGWDPGCELKILANQKQRGTRLSSPAACSAMDKFELYSQGREEVNYTVFSLSPFKDGIYSVEFDSVLSSLQAFSICIAVLDGRKLCEDPEFSSLHDGKTSLESMLKDEVRVPNGNNGDIPAKYVSYPPLSPVGRV